MGGCRLRSWIPASPAWPDRLAVWGRRDRRPKTVLLEKKNRPRFQDGGCPQGAPQAPGRRKAKVPLLGGERIRFHHLPRGLSAPADPLHRLLYALARPRGYPLNSLPRLAA